MLIKPGQALGSLEALLDAPALPGHAHQRGQRHRVRAVAAQVGQLAGAVVAADEQLMLTGLVIGLAFGAVFGWMGYRATGGRRDFTSTSQIVASRYDVMCNPAQAEEARAHLARFSLRG